MAEEFIGEYIDYLDPIWRVSKTEFERMGFTALDPIHSVGPLFPLDQMQGYAMMYGITWGPSYFTHPNWAGAGGGCWRNVDGWLIMGPGKTVTPEEIKKREPIHRKHMEKHAAEWDERWTAAVKELTDIIQWMENLDYEKDPDMSDPLQRLKLLEYFDRINRSLLRAWEIHFQFELPCVLYWEEFKSLCLELFPGIEGKTMADFCVGLGLKEMEVEATLWRFGELALELGIADIIKTAPLDEVIPKLKEVKAGRKWLDELMKTEAIKVYGRGGVMNLGYPSWREDPRDPISFIKGYIARIERGEKLVQKEKLNTRRERTTQEYLKKLKSDAEREKFLKSLNIVRKTYAALEDHGYYIDEWLRIATRIKMLQLGKRFVTEGYLNDQNDIFFLTPAEVRSVIADLMVKRNCDVPYIKADYREAIEKRKKFIERKLKEPPPAYGDPRKMRAEDMYLDAHTSVSEMTEDWFRKMAAPLPEKVTKLEGIAASPGIAEGRARVVLLVEDLQTVEEGEILVCMNTTPAWTSVFPKVKAVTADSGGVLGHTAIVCREYGRPCVVATAKGTQAIKTGDMIRVDGDKGIVEILRE